MFYLIEYQLSHTLKFRSKDLKIVLVLEMLYCGESKLDFSTDVVRILAIRIKYY